MKDNISYRYDPKFDTLNVYLGKAENFYSDEHETGIFFIRNEFDDSIIGVEILYFSKRDKERLNKDFQFNFNFNSVQ